MFEVIETTPGFEEEFGMVSGFIFKTKDIPFLIVKNYSGGPIPDSHKTQWPTMLEGLRGINFLLWMQSQFTQEYSIQPQTPDIELKITPTTPLARIETIDPNLMFEQAKKASRRLRGISFTWGRTSDLEIEYPFAGNYYLELESQFNIAKFVAKILPVSCAIPNLPLEETERGLNRIYHNYPKPW